MSQQQYRYDHRLPAAPSLPPKPSAYESRGPPVPPKPAEYQQGPQHLKKSLSESNRSRQNISKTLAFMKQVNQASLDSSPGLPPKIPARANNISVMEFQDRRPEFHPLGPRGPGSGLQRSQTHNPYSHASSNWSDDEESDSYTMRAEPYPALKTQPFGSRLSSPTKPAHALPPLPTVNHDAASYDYEDDNYEDYDVSYSNRASIDRTASTYTTQTSYSGFSEKMDEGIYPDKYSNGTFHYEKPVDIPDPDNYRETYDISDRSWGSDSFDYTPADGTRMDTFLENVKMELDDNVSVMPLKLPQRPNDGSCMENVSFDASMSAESWPDKYDSKKYPSVDTALDNLDSPLKENMCPYPYSPPVMRNPYSYDVDLFEASQPAETFPLPVNRPSLAKSPKTFHHSKSFNQKYSAGSSFGDLPVSEQNNSFSSAAPDHDAFTRTKSELHIHGNLAKDFQDLRLAPLVQPPSFSHSAYSDYSSLDPSLQSSMRSSQRSEDMSLMNQLGLPPIPTSNPVLTALKISSKEYETCSKIWNLSSLAKWLYSLQKADQDVHFGELQKILCGLFTHFVPTMSSLQAESIAIAALDTMKKDAFISVDGQLVTMDIHHIPTGIYPQLTGFGCYSMSHSLTSENCDEVHEVEKLRCYSSKCSLTLPVKHFMPIVDLTEKSETDWAAYYNIASETLEDLGKRELRYQYAIHELITGEESYLRDLGTLVQVFGESLSKQIPPVMEKQDQFCEQTFGSIKKLIEVNTTYLLEPFKMRQKTQGPYIDGVADIILEWIKHAKQPYLQYSSIYLFSDRMMRKEKETNSRFSSWFESAARDPRTCGVPHGFFFHRAIPRLARYSLLLGAIHKMTIESAIEWSLLERCIAQCDELTRECNKSLAQTEKLIELVDFKERLRFKGAECFADLKLKDARRKILLKGDIVRRGEYRLDWIDAHMILLDNYLILSKVKKGPNGDMYYVTKKPIPLDLLILESLDEDPVTKNTKLGVGTFTTHASPTETRRTSRLIGGSPTKQDVGSYVTAIEDASQEKELLYPFRVTHLGRQGASYTLYAPSKHEQLKWREAILEAKRNYGLGLFTMNSEPFKLKVVSEYGFAYESNSGPKLSVFSPGTAIDRALNESPERVSAGTPIPRMLFRSRINCGACFVFADNREYTILGMDFGAYLCETTLSKSGAHAWKRCLEISKISQIDAIPDLNLLVVLADKNLCYYNLDSVIFRAQKRDEPPRTIPANIKVESSVKAVPTTSLIGYRLSKHRDVGYFACGKLRDRIVVLYKHRENISSVIKVIEPIKEKGLLSRRSKMAVAKGAAVDSTEYFSEIEKFTVPSDSYGVEMFKQTVAIASSKGFEIVSVDMKIPQSVPITSSITPAIITQFNKVSSNQTKPLTVEGLKKRLEQCKPVAMFRVGDKKLVLCYDEMILFIDNQGNLTGPCVIELICKAKSAAYQHPYLIVCDNELVEIRRADKEGQLRQVITGKDVRLLDKREGQIRICMAHPKEAGRQLIVELLGNEFVVEDDNSSLAAL